METLFKLDSKGKKRSWHIEVLAENGSGRIVTTAGLVDGAKTKTEVLVTQGKNIGRSNETTPYAQALAEAEATWNSKVREGYVDDITKVTQAILASGIPAPMLAQKYSPDGSQKSSKTLAQMKLAGKTIHVQPKFDGNRCLIKVSASGVEMFTRKGDRMLPVPHIERQIFQSFKNLDENSPLEFILDGELFTDKFSFNTLNGLLRREDKTEEHLSMLEEVNYHIYDVMKEYEYSRRFEIIRNFQNRNVVLVPSSEIIADDLSIRLQMEEALQAGYEGVMLRRLDTGYENKRSWSLVKYKDFQDAEYRVLDIIEDARGGGIVGAFVLELDTPTKDRDGREIKTFRAGIKDLSQDEGRKMLENKTEYIGKFATVEFFSLSEYGIPRFGKLKGFRNDL